MWARNDRIGSIERTAAKIAADSGADSYRCSYLTSSVGILLNKEMIVVSSGRRQIRTAYNRARKHATVPFPLVDPGARVESRRPKVAPCRRPNPRVLSLVFLVEMSASD